jgi:PAP2 superfamily
MITRREALWLGGAAFASLGTAGLTPALARPDLSRIVLDWYKLVLELVRHTATYTPPVASRAFGYLGVIACEAFAAGKPGMVSLAGQLNGFNAPPARPAGIDDAVVLHFALAAGVMHLFGNTGPTGKRVLATATERWRERATVGLDMDTAAASAAHGEAIARHVLAWAATDGGEIVVNMGFPLVYTLGTAPGAWVPTSIVSQQQVPLLPDWGKNRPFAMKTGNACPLPPPPDYSEEPGSAFHAEALEVHRVTSALSDEQKRIARFWSDDPMLSPTPPGHWIAIVLQIAERDAMPADRLVEVLARLGVALADAFIGCWHTKYEFNLLRPVTYIRKVIDPKWAPLLITPPFPEYPSGHSTQSGAAEAVLTAFFGERFAFEDSTHQKDGLGVRQFSSFAQAAEEAGISRLYGGIHFRSAIALGLEQGRCIGAHAVALTLKAA